MSRSCSCLALSEACAVHAATMEGGRRTAAIGEEPSVTVKSDTRSEGATAVERQHQGRAR